MGFCGRDNCFHRSGLAPLTGIGMGPTFPVAPKGCFPVLGAALSPVPVIIPLSELWVAGFWGCFVVMLQSWMTAQTNPFRHDRVLCCMCIQFSNSVIIFCLFCKTISLSGGRGFRFFPALMGPWVPEVLGGGKIACWSLASGWGINWQSVSLNCRNVT